MQITYELGVEASWHCFLEPSHKEQKENKNALWSDPLICPYVMCLPKMVYHWEKRSILVDKI